MAKYDVGSRILFRHPHSGEKVRGRITRSPDKSNKYSVVTDSKQRLKVHSSQIKGESPDRILILEGRLDRNLRSKRSYGVTFQQLLQAYGVEALYEKMHTREGLRAFLQREARKPEYRVIHLMSHGNESKRGRKAILELTHDKFDLEEQSDMFRGLDGKIIIFSSCLLGKNSKAMNRIKEVSGAAAVVAYTKSIYDSYTNIAEHLFYHQLFDNELEPIRAVEVVQKLIVDGKIRATEEVSRSPIFRCF